MGRLGNINNYVVQNQQQQQIKPSEAAVQAMSNMQMPTVQQSVQQVAEHKPVLNSNPMAGAEQVNFREKTLQNLDENDFKARQKELNASDKEYWGAKLKQNPESSYSILREYFASDETPEEKAKRERRDALGETFRNLGSVIGSAANLYYAHRGGIPIDLNSENEKRNERARILKEKQDAIQRQREQMLVNAKMDDIKNERAKSIAEAKTKEEAKAKALEHDRKLAILEIENMYKLGQIDAQTKAKMQELTHKAETEKELEGVKYNYKEQLAVNNNKRIVERNNGKSNATIRVPRKDKEGYDEYRKNDLTNPTVVSQIYHSLPEEYRPSNKWGDKPTLFDMQSAIGRALNDGKISEIASSIELTGGSDNGKQSEVKPIDIAQYEVQDFTEHVRPAQKGNVKPNNGVITVDDLKEAINKDKKKKEEFISRGKDSLDKDKTRYNVYPSDTFR